MDPYTLYQNEEYFGAWAYFNVKNVGLFENVIHFRANHFDVSK